jgi:CMP-N-acetylneuraminic acid synthetase
MKIITPVIGFIFARGGSKGVPRKNIRPLAGKPLISHSIEAAKASQHIERVIVSTDDDEIARVALHYGAEVPFLRPPELAGDRSPELLSWRHAIHMVQETLDIKVGTFVSVPAPSPLRTSADIDSCIEALSDGETDLVITVSPARHHPRFSMVTIDEHGYASLLDQSGARYTNRQEASPAFDVTGVTFAARPDFVMRADDLFGGRVRAVQIPEVRAIDIDSELDFELAEYLALKALRL